jgi:hypothetical protein
MTEQVSQNDQPRTENQGNYAFPSMPTSTQETPGVSPLALLAATCSKIGPAAGVASLATAVPAVALQAIPDPQLVAKDPLLSVSGLSGIPVLTAGHVPTHVAVQLTAAQEHLTIQSTASIAQPLANSSGMQILNSIPSLLNSGNILTHQNGQELKASSAVQNYDIDGDKNTNPLILSAMPQIPSCIISNQPGQLVVVPMQQQQPELRIDASANMHSVSLPARTDNQYYQLDNGKIVLRQPSNTVPVLKPKLEKAIKSNEVNLRIGI